MKLILIKLVNGEVIDEELDMSGVLSVRFDFQMNHIDAREHRGKLELIGSNSIIIEPESSNNVYVFVRDWKK